MGKHHYVSDSFNSCRQFNILTWFFNAFSVFSTIIVEILEIKREDRSPNIHILSFYFLFLLQKNIKMFNCLHWISNIVLLKSDKCKLKSKVPLIQSWRVSLWHYILSLECSGPCINLSNKRNTSENLTTCSVN